MFGPDLVLLSTRGQKRKQKKKKKKKTQAYKIRDKDGRSAIDHRSSHVLAPVKH